MSKASVILKLFVVPRLQPRRHRALTEARSHSRPDVVPRGATTGQGKGGGNRQHQKKKTPKMPPKQRCVCSDDEKLGPIRSNNYIWWQRERNTVMYHQRRSYQDRRRKVRTTGFLALQFIVKCLKAPMPRVSPYGGAVY